MNRSKIIDIMKAIGIILVVVGHCTNIFFLYKFIYLFHLALFFVISGYLYDDKYSNKPWDYIGKILKKYLKSYFIYNTILILGRNLFIQIGILDNMLPRYGFNEILCSFLNTFMFISNEPFSAAMWFFPILALGLIMFNFITSYSSKFNNNKFKELLRFSLIALLTIIGIYLNKNNLNIGLHFQTSFAIMPFIYLGQIIKKYAKKHIKPSILLAIPLLIIIVIITYKTPGQVKLSENNLWNPYLFYTLASLMIYIIYTISFYINKYISLFTKILSFIGKNTIIIMCFHILFFKLFDYFYIKLVKHEYTKLGMFTCSYKNLWIIYSIVGVFGPLCIQYITKKV